MIVSTRNETYSAAVTSNSNTISHASKLIISCNFTGEEEDPRGGDSLSTRGLRAVGLLCRPRQG